MSEMNHIVDDYRSSLYQYISDASKDAQGFRIRFDYSEFTTAELQREADYWSEEVEITCREEEEAQHRLLVHFEAKVLDLIAIGAGNRETAIRWLKESYEPDGYMEWYGDEHVDRGGAGITVIRLES